MSEQDWEYSRGDDEWGYSRGDSGWRLQDAGMGMLRVALLFGSAMVVLALLIVPMLDRDRFDRPVAAGLDVINTGSVQAPASYTVRRSVLHPSTCVIDNNGLRGGNC